MFVKWGEQNVNTHTSTSLEHLFKGININYVQFLIKINIFLYLQ